MEQQHDESLLIVDDDSLFCESLAGALRRRGFRVVTEKNARTAAERLHTNPPRFAIIDLRIGNDSGLALVEQAATIEPPIRAVVLTGYASIATAVEAVKLGAIHYLAKPAEVEDILTALRSDPGGNAAAPLPEQPPSIRKLEWEHIQRVLQAHQNNISATARALNMHRRTLQRKLRKRPVRR
jgi:two-component system response regulator RegA